MKNCKKHKMDYMKMNSRELSERKAYKKLRTKNDEVRKTKINRSLKQNLTQSSTYVRRHEILLQVDKDAR